MFALDCVNIQTCSEYCRTDSQKEPDAYWSDDSKRQERQSVGKVSTQVQRIKSLRFKTALSNRFPQEDREMDIPHICTPTPLNRVPRTSGGFQGTNLRLYSVWPPLIWNSSWLVKSEHHENIMNFTRDSCKYTVTFDNQKYRTHPGATGATQAKEYKLIFWLILTTRS